MSDDSDLVSPDSLSEEGQEIYYAALKGRQSRIDKAIAFELCNWIEAGRPGEFRGCLRDDPDLDEVSKQMYFRFPPRWGK